MIEFIGAFLGACVGVVSVYFFSYKKIMESIKEQCKTNVIGLITFHED